MKIKVFTAFSGYDSQCLALERLSRDFPDFSYELVGWSEIDKYAIIAHNALFPGIPNYGDISKINWEEVPDFDFFTYSSPCQDFSLAGKRMGGEEGSGTRSSLLWECRRAIIAKKPKYLLMENVKGLMTKKFKPLLGKWLSWLESQGYKSFVEILNAEHYQVPQHRERVFVVSILDKESHYDFPDRMPLTKSLADILEDEVDEKYFLSDKLVKGFIAHSERKKAEGCRSTDNFIKVKEATKLGYAEAYEGDSVNLALPNSTTRRGRVGKKVAQTLDCGCQQGVIIREGSYAPSGYNSCSVLNPKGIAPTMMENHGRVMAILLNDDKQ